MLVKYAIQIVIIGAEIALQLRAQSRVRVIDASRVVVTFPEFDWSHVGREKYGTAQERIQWGGESGTNCRL